MELSQGKSQHLYGLKTCLWSSSCAWSDLEGRGLLTSQGIPVKYRTEIMRLLQVVLQPKEVLVIHFKVHQKGNTDIIKGN